MTPTLQSGPWVAMLVLTIWAISYQAAEPRELITDSGAEMPTTAATRAADFTLNKGGLGKPCNLHNITVTQAETGRVVDEKTEYEVVVSNMCHCSQSNVTVRCFGLNSAEPVDPQVIKRVDGETCIIDGGGTLTRGEQVRFKYAWITYQDFPVVSTNVEC